MPADCRDLHHVQGAEFEEARARFVSQIVEVQILDAEANHHDAPGRFEAVARLAEDSALRLNAEADQRVPGFNAQGDVSFGSVLGLR